MLLQKEDNGQRAKQRFAGGYGSPDAQLRI